MATGLASEKRVFLARLAEARDTADGGPKKRLLKRSAVALVIVAMLAVLGMWISGFFSAPKELVEIRTMVDQQIVQLQKVARNEAPFTYNDTGFRKSWERMRDMSPEVRAQAREEMERLLRAREKAEQQSYFAMPPQERQKELDRRIKAEESRRQAWQKQRESRNRGTGGKGGQGGVGGQAGQGNNASGGQGRGSTNGSAAQANAAGSPTNAGGGQGGGGGGRPAGTRGSSDEARTARSKRRIDSTDPDERAQNAEYRRQLDLRRQQLGINPGRGRGG